MRVLVTGAAGFIGSHVVEELLEHQYTVRALAHYNSESRVGNLRFVDAGSRGERLEIVFGDVCDGRFVLETAKNCEAILHLAALIGIPYSYVAPASYLETNIRGTMNVLEAARTVGVRRVVVTSTSEVYGTALYTPIDESHPLQAQSPYSASKIGADKLAESYARSFAVPVVVLRPFNTYGPRQSARALIPTILSQLKADPPALSLGNLAPKRDLVYVTDTARAFRLALERKSIEGETIHFGSGRALSVAEIAALCMKVTGQEVEIDEDPDRVRPESSEVGLLLANSDKASRLLGWSPTVSLEEGLSIVAEFISENRQQYFAGRYTI
jgi:NAD dependent epimerase/dehydratase